MIHRLILSTFGLLTLSTCQTQNVSQNANSSEKTEVMTSTTNSTTNSTPVKETKTKEPEMSVGLPPDKEAVEQADKEAAAETTNKQEVIYLKEGEKKFLKEYGMNITFKKITEDSRCPKDVNCVWEGAATAEIEVMGLETRPMILKISTVNQGQKYSKVQQFNGYDISLDQLTPGTTSEKGMKQLQGSYKIVLKINKAGTNSSPTR